jgi:hypothetical protein
VVIIESVRDHMVQQLACSRGNAKSLSDRAIEKQGVQGIGLVDVALVR